MIVMEKKLKLEPVFWASLILVFSQVLTLYTSSREKAFIEASQIISPDVSLGLTLAYFFGVVVLVGVIFFLVPVSALKVVFKILFIFLFCWGMLVTLGLSLPFVVAAIISVAGGAIWFLTPRVWLHNLLLVFALVSVGSVFGFLLSPWTVIAFLLATSVYDILAVRFGYMLWLVKKMSEIETLPAFVIPREIAGWNTNLKKAGFNRLLESESTEREYSILGGGDIGFPLLLIVSVFFAYGLSSSVIVAFFSLLGLITAYGIQRFFLKGKPMPALPPISLLSLIGFLIVHFI